MNELLFRVRFGLCLGLVMHDTLLGSFQIVGCGQDCLGLIDNCFKLVQGLIIVVWFTIGQEVGQVHY